MIQLRIRKATVGGLGGGLWLASLLAIAVLRIELLVLAFVALSWIAIAMLVSENFARREAGWRGLECRLTLYRTFVLALITVLWLISMLEVLSISGLRTYLLLVNIWVIWAGALLLIGRTLEIEWRKQDSAR